MGEGRATRGKDGDGSGSQPPREKGLEGSEGGRGSGNEEVRARHLLPV